MAKDAAIVDAVKTETALEAVVDTAAFQPAFPGHGEAFIPPPPQRGAPSAAQHAWLLAHPNYVRSSHFFGQMIERGTLHEDGTFVPEAKHPVMDGPSCFGVGIPTKR
jgi:hypothetical protein